MKWRPQALRDLSAIEAFYLDFAPAYASSVMEGLLDAAMHLEHMPEMGRTVPEIGDSSIREIIHREYRIIYFRDREADVVEVLTVQHSNRQLGAGN